MFEIVVESLAVFLTGLLAGEEFIVRYGVHPSLSALDDRSHLAARIMLVRKLKVVVPAIMIPAALAGILALIAGGTGPGCIPRALGVVSLVAVLVFSFAGTVPINIKVNDTWTVDEPPADWKRLVKRWVFIDTFRSSAAILAFAFFVVAAAVQLAHA